MCNPLHFEISDMFTSANISVQKLDQFIVREFLTKNSFEAKMRKIKEILMSADSLSSGSDKGIDDKDNHV